MQNNTIVVIGAGCAGLSTSYELHKIHKYHLLFETRKHIGGRTSTFVEPQTSEEIDNGQHLLSKAYTSFLELIGWLGNGNELIKQRYLNVPFGFSGGKVAPFKIKNLPFRLGEIFGLWNLKFLSFQSKIKIIKLVNSLSKISISKDKRLIDFLLEQEQSDEAIRYFWKPMCLAIMNNAPEYSNASVFINSIIKAFFGSKNQRKLIFPKSTFANLFQNFEQKNKFCKLITSVKIERIESSADYFVIFATASDDTNSIAQKLQDFKKLEPSFSFQMDNNKIKFTAKTIISAVPPNSLKKIIPDDWRQNNYFQFLEKIDFNPIVSMYLWVKSPIFSQLFYCLQDGNFHWVFNKNLTNKSDDIFTYCLLKSNAKDLVNLNANQIFELAKSDLINFFPKFRFYDVVHYFVVKEKLATVDLNPEFLNYRPIQKTPISNFYICGDWTETHLPATIESATLSGKYAVDFFNRDLSYEYS